MVRPRKWHGAKCIDDRKWSDLECGMVQTILIKKMVRTRMWHGAKCIDDRENGQT